MNQIYDKVDLDGFDTENEVLDNILTDYVSLSLWCFLFQYFFDIKVKSGSEPIDQSIFNDQDRRYYESAR